MDPENITGTGQPDASQLNAADPVSTVGSGTGTQPATPQTGVEALTLADINKQLGKNFLTKESALKSLSDTFSYVGKKKEDIEKEVRATVQTDDRISKLAQELEIERKERFYDRNPQYADQNVRKLIDSLGGTPSEVVNREEFKQVFEKVSSYDKSAKLKTVLESNPRLASSKDSLTKAREVRDLNTRPDGQVQGRAIQEVERLAVDAVKSAFEM